jgi:pimeloyl-ACP methyl ester carboxylesterase
MPSTSSDHRRRPPPLRWLRSLLLLTTACTFVGAPQRARPPLPLPGRQAPTAIAEPHLVEHHQLAGGRSHGVLQAGGERVRFQLWRQGRDRPLVLLVPILAGGEDLMDQVANRLQARGYDTAFCARVGPALKAPQRGPELDELFRRTVLHQRLLLRWLRSPPPGTTPPPAVFALGMSLGGMVATVLAAQEPELAGTAILMSGGGVADLVVTSSEPRVQAWRRWRHATDGVGDDHLRWELGAYLQHEPLRYAKAVATDKVLLVTGTLDTVVPKWHQDLLWEALGRPARLQVPLGHYSAALAIDAILDAAAQHFDRCPRP